MMKRILIAACCVLLVSVLLAAITQNLHSEQQNNATVTILYNNYAFAEGLQSDWGFSCLFKGMEKTILFDTGAKGDLLFENIGKLKINPGDVELVVISHNHTDHTGGLLAFLAKNIDVAVYLPPSMQDSFVQQVKGTGAEVVIPNAPLEICKGVQMIYAFKDAYGEGFLQMGVGRILEIGAPAK